MSGTLIVLKPSRFLRIPRKDWLMLLGILAVSIALLIGSCFFYPHLTKENTHELTGSITSSRIDKDYSPRRYDTAHLIIDNAEYNIPIRSRELRQLIENCPTGVARIIATDRNEIAELEYDGTLYHTLEQENDNRLGIRIVFLIFGLLFLAGDLFFLTLVLFSYSIVILRKRPKNIRKHILIEK